MVLPSTDILPKANFLCFYKKARSDKILFLICYIAFLSLLRLRHDKKCMKKQFETNASFGATAFFSVSEKRSPGVCDKTTIILRKNVYGFVKITSVIR